MQLSVELTLYPLKDDHMSVIRACINKINEFEGLHINTVPTATIVVGDYAAVMNMLHELMAWTYNAYGRCVFVAKFLPGYEAH